MAIARKISNLYNEVARYLKSGRLNSACAFLSMQFARHSAHAQLEEVRAIQEDNERLLSFFSQGIDDPRRQQLRDELLERAWILADKFLSLEYPSKPIHPAPKFSADQSSGSSSDLLDALDELDRRTDSDELLGWIFERVAEARRLEEDERRALQLTILDEQLPLYVRATLLGAVSLLVTQWFDARLVEDLYIFTLDDQHVQLRAMAWVTLVMVVLHHSHRIEHLPRLREQYQLLAESEPELLKQLLISLLQCREVYSNEEKLTELVNNADEEEMITSGEKVKEFFRLIADGVDMSFVSFSHLAKIPFFNEKNRHHWFMPFSPQHPIVRQITDTNPKAEVWIKLLMQSVAQCETDKYSAFLSMQSAGAGLLDKISQQLIDKGIVFDEVVPLRLITVVRNYLHDLFRYCYLNQQGRDSRIELFKGELNLCLSKWLKAAFCDLDYQHRVADFLLDKGYWGEAAHAYSQLKEYDESEEFLQRLAYCLQQMEYQENRNKLFPTSDVELYHFDYMDILARCNELYPGNKWTEKKLADVYDYRCNYGLELICLREALTHHPDDNGLLARLGHALTMNGKPQEALTYLFKADVQKEGQTRVYRGLAEAYLKLNDIASAERYIRKVLNRPEPSSEDLKFGAEIALLAGDLQLCIERFIKCNTHRAFILDSEYERERLQNLGMDLTLAQLVNEVVADRYEQTHNEAE